MDTETPLPAAQAKERIPTDALVHLVGELTRQLNESNHKLIRQIVIVIGLARAQALLDEVLAIEAEGGRMTLDGSRRKTPGGLFISLARAQASPEERRKLRDFGPKKRQQPPSAAAQLTPGQPGPKEKAAPVVTLTWEEVKPIVAQALVAIGEAKTVKLTLIGRPSKIVQQPNCVVIAMKGKAPASLPKGLPMPPANSAITWAVFIVNKQWNAVKDSITNNPEDNLIVEGYPLLDPKSGSSVVLVTSCKSVLQERATREAKKGTT